MGAAIDLSALTFPDIAVSEFKDLLKQKVVDAPILTDIMTIYPKIVHSTEIGFIRPTLGLIGVLDAGCGGAANVTGVTAASKKKWETARISIIKDECYTDLDNNFAKFVRKEGTSISNLIGTQYFDYLLSFIPADVQKMIFRKAFFERKAVKNVSAGGTLGNGTDIKYFNTFDGIFAQLDVIMTARPTQKVPIAENLKATRAAQFADLTPELAYGYFTKLIDAAPSTLAAQPDRVIISTRYLASQAARYLQKQGTDTVLQRLEAGYELTYIDGVKVVVVPFMDECINYFTDGTKIDNPHRAIYTLVSNLAVGFGSDGGFSEVQTFFDDRSELNTIRIKDTMDSKVLDDEMILLAM